MAWDYDIDAAAAIEDIEDAGRPVSILVRGAPTGSAADPEPGAETPYATFALMVPYREDQINGTAVIQGDLQAMVPALAIVPKAGDILLDGATRYTIINPGTVKPGPTVVMHVMQVREVGQIA